MADIPVIQKQSIPIEKADIQDLAMNLSEVVRYNKFISENIKQVVSSGFKKPLAVEVLPSTLDKEQTDIAKEQLDLMKEEAVRSRKSEEKKLTIKDVMAPIANSQREIAKLNSNFNNTISVFQRSSVLTWKEQKAFLTKEREERLGNYQELLRENSVAYNKILESPALLKSKAGQQKLVELSSAIESTQAEIERLAKLGDVQLKLSAKDYAKRTILDKFIGNKAFTKISDTIQTFTGKDILGGIKQKIEMSREQKDKLSLDRQSTEDLAKGYTKTPGMKDSRLSSKVRERKYPPNKTSVLAHNPEIVYLADILTKEGDETQKELREIKSKTGKGRKGGIGGALKVVGGALKVAGKFGLVGAALAVATYIITKKVMPDTLTVLQKKMDELRNKQALEKDTQKKKEEDKRKLGVHVGALKETPEDIKKRKDQEEQQKKIMQSPTSFRQVETHRTYKGGGLWGTDASLQTGSSFEAFKTKQQETMYQQLLAGQKDLALVAYKKRVQTEKGWQDIMGMEVKPKTQVGASESVLNPQAIEFFKRQSIPTTANGITTVKDVQATPEQFVTSLQNYLKSKLSPGANSMGIDYYEMEKKRRQQTTLQYSSPVQTTKGVGTAVPPQDVRITEDFMPQFNKDLMEIYGGVSTQIKKSADGKNLDPETKQKSRLWLQDSYKAIFDSFIANASIGAPVEGPSGTLSVLKDKLEQLKKSGEVKDGIVRSDGSYIQIDPKDNIYATTKDISVAPKPASTASAQQDIVSAKTMNDKGSSMVAEEQKQTNLLLQKVIDLLTKNGGQSNQPIIAQTSNLYSASSIMQMLEGNA